MSTCLTTKLDGVIDDKDFRTPSEFRISVNKQTTYLQNRAWFTLNSRVNQTVTIINEKDGEDNYFYDINGNNLGKSTEFAANAGRQVFCSNGTYEIVIPNKYAIASFDMGRFAPQTNFFTFDIDELKYITTIQTLQSSGVAAKGDLKSLAECTTLENLTIERVNIKGDIEDLKNLTKLQYLRLSVDNNITGDISVVENMPNLRNLELGGSIGFTGNLSSLANCSKLTWVNLPCVSGMSNIKGNISALANKNLLTAFYAQAEYDIEGDISVFSTNTDTLQHLYLGWTNVSGDIADLAPCKRLVNLYLDQASGVTGDLGEFLEDKPFLNYISISGTGITGDITDGDAPNITSVYLQNTGVSGNIGQVSFEGYTPSNVNLAPISAHEAADGFVKRNTNIVDFNASNTLIEGDINVFANCPKLNNLQIYNTKISGDISALAGISTLTGLNIGYTDVFGDIGVGLANCMNLRELYLESCRYITGDLSKCGNNMRFIAANNSTGQFTWETVRSSSANIIAMQNIHIGEYLDAMLINQANCQPNYSNANAVFNAISVRGSHSTDPTVRANANNAVRALMNKGYSVTINGVLQTEALLGQDAVAGGN